MRGNVSEPKCFACGRQFTAAQVNRARVASAITVDGQIVNVGPDCYQHILEAHPDPYQPPFGGPALQVTWRDVAPQDCGRPHPQPYCLCVKCCVAWRATSTKERA